MAFSLEFRAHAVQFVKLHPELTYAQAAAYVGVGSSTLVKWLRLAGAGRGSGPKVRDHPSPRMQMVFDLLDAGMSIPAASAAVGMSFSNCYRMWARFRPMTPLQRGRRGGLALTPDIANNDAPAHIPRGHWARLTFSDRAQIEYLFKSQRLSARKIARLMGVEPSTVSREITRNSRDGVYDACFADEQASRRRTQLKVRKLDTNIRLRREVIRLITHTYSHRIPLHFPQHIARRLRSLYPQDPSMHISHESIYQAIYVTGECSQRDEIKLEKVLRSGRVGRKPRSKLAGMTHTRKGRTWCQESFICLRDEDFPDAHTKLVPGHWEGDLVIGSGGKSALVMLLERSSRYVLIRRLPDTHDTKTVTETIMDMVKELSMPGPGSR
ncbi:IS30 family transposase [Staphylococcus chromogenes]|nr:IS30 family transposase [Staphylococcus chromogenes]